MQLSDYAALAVDKRSIAALVPLQTRPLLLHKIPDWNKHEKATVTRRNTAGMFTMLKTMRCLCRLGLRSIRTRYWSPFLVLIKLV